MYKRQTLTGLIRDQNKKLSQLDTDITATITALRLLLHTDHTTALLSKLETTIKANLDILIDIQRAAQSRQMSRYLIPPSALKQALLETMEDDPKINFPFPVSHFTDYYALQTVDFYENEYGVTSVWNIPISYFESFHINQMLDNDMLAVSKTNELILINPIDLSNYCIKPNRNTIVCETRFCIRQAPAHCIQEIPFHCAREYLKQHYCKKIDETRFSIVNTRVVLAKQICPDKIEQVRIPKESIVKIDALCRIESEELVIPNRLVGFDRLHRLNKPFLNLRTKKLEFLNLSFNPRETAQPNILIKDLHPFNISTINSNEKDLSWTLSISSLIITCLVLVAVGFGAAVLWRQHFKRVAGETELELENKDDNSKYDEEVDISI